MIAHALLVQAGYAVQQLHLLERIIGKAHGDLEHADQARVVADRVVDRLEHRGGRQRGTLAVLDAFEGIQGGRVIGLDVENFAVKLDRAIHVVQVLLVELGDAVLKAHGFGRISRQLGFVLQDAQQLLPIAGRLEQHVQAPQRSQVVRI